MIRAKESAALVNDQHDQRVAGDAAHGLAGLSSTRIDPYI
jgi:hypothetical protein